MAAVETRTIMTQQTTRKRQRRDRAVAHAAGQALIDAALGNTVVFDRLEDRQMMAAHVAGDPATYATIQAAVDAAKAGGTVTVDAGSYAESVRINKALTVQGAQAGVDARSNVRQSATGVESVVTGATTTAGVGAVFTVAADGVTIDGFTVQGQTTKDLATGAGIVIAPGVSGTTIVNDLVQNNVSGLFLSNASASNPATIRHNVFKGNNNAGTNGGRGIYTDQSISGGTLTNVVIDANSFVNNRGGTSTTTLEAAVALESTSNAASQTNITVSNNTFDANGKAILAFNTTGLLFTGNVVTRGLDWYSGIVRFEGNDHDVTITGNTLYANTGPAVAVDCKGFPGDNSGFVVTGNNIYGNGTTSGKNFGIVVNGDVYQGTFDARYNYWGNASGPSGDGSGTGDSVYGSGHVVSGSSWSVTAGAGSELFAPFATAPVQTQDTAYWGLSATDGSKIQAEDFNHGGEGIAYHDTTSGNSGGQYRTTGVDVATTADAGGGYTVTNTTAGEWLDYSVNLTAGGTYRLDFRMAAAAAGATFRVLVDGAQIGADAAVPNTGSATTFATVSLNNVSLTAGGHTVRVLFVTNTTGATTGPAFNWFQMVNTAPVSVPTAPTALAATANGSDTVNLTWTNTAANASTVKVLRSTDGGATYVTLMTLAGTASSYADAGLKPLTSYLYKVVASNAGGDSPATAAASTTTAPSSTAPTSLTQLTWTSATSGWSAPQINQTIKNKTITLRGTAYATGIGTHASSTISYDLAGRFGTFAADVGVDDEVGGQGNVRFQIYGDNALLFDSGVVTGSSAVQHATVNVSGVKTLTLIASAGIDGTIDYDHADWAGAQLTVAPPVVAVPAAPTSLTATATSTSTVNLSWTAGGTTQTAYAVDRSTDGGATYTTIATVSNTTYADTGLAAGTTYTYRVRATNTAGSSAAGNAATVTTISATATMVNLSTITPTSAQADWGTIQSDATIKGKPITLRGATYATGLGTHASSTITYDVAGKYAAFVSDAGVDDETGGQGNVRFQVYGDGVLLYDSGVLTGTSPAAHLNVNLSGVKTLTLVASPGIAGTIDFDHADWAGAKLVAAAATPTAPVAAAAVKLAKAVRFAPVQAKTVAELKRAARAAQAQAKAAAKAAAKASHAKLTGKTAKVAGPKKAVA